MGLFTLQILSKISCNYKLWVFQTTNCISMEPLKLQKQDCLESRVLWNSQSKIIALETRVSKLFLLLWKNAEDFKKSICITMRLMMSQLKTSLIWLPNKLIYTSLHLNSTESDIKDLPSFWTHSQVSKNWKDCILTKTISTHRQVIPCTTLSPKLKIWRNFVSATTFLKTMLVPSWLKLFSKTKI